MDGTTTTFTATRRRNRRACATRRRRWSRGCIAAPAIPPAARCWRRAAASAPRRSRSCGRIPTRCSPASTSRRPLSRGGADAHPGCRPARAGAAAGRSQGPALPAGELRSCLRLLRAGAPPRSPGGPGRVAPRGAAGRSLTVIEGDHGSVLLHPEDAAARAAIACQAALQRRRAAAIRRSGGGSRRSCGRPASPIFVFCRTSSTPMAPGRTCRGLRAAHLRGDGGGHPRRGDPGRAHRRAGLRCGPRRARPRGGAGGQLRLYLLRGTAFVPPA